MTAHIVSTLSPLVIDSTTLAAEDFELAPTIARDVFRHDANKFASAQTKLGAAPSVRFRTPFLAAYNLMGFGLYKAAAFKFTFAKFTDYTRTAGATHPQYGLAASATAVARIIGASVNQRGILMADVAVVPLSSDGMTHPIGAPANVALPTLSSEPALHTLGPIEVNGTRISGARNQGIDLGNDFVGEPHDGDIYLRNVGELEANPMLMGEHSDPITLLSSLGLFGLAISATVKLYFKAIDATTGAALTTGGISLSAASGSIDPGPVRMRRGALPVAGFSVQPLSTSQTHPVTVSTSATMPAA